MAVFIACCWPFMKQLGIEVDEAMIGNGIYERLAPWYSWHFGDNEIPVMLLTYLGALKTWLYSVLFLIWTPGPVSLRLPMVLVGAATVALTFRFVDVCVGRRAAWIAAALLATDPSFVLTGSFDFGFIAFQFVFKLGALLLLVRFHQRPAAWKLAGAFFLLGLALWDKAVFLWILAALGVAAIVVFRREVWSHVTRRNCAIACTAFVAGALPFIVYNIARPLETFTSNVKLEPDNPLIKVVLLKRSIDGSGLFGWVTAPDAGPSPVAPHSLAQRTAFLVSRTFHAPVSNWMIPAFILSLFLIPWALRTPVRRVVLFSLLVFAITWLLMFVTTGAGGAVHHVILLWPFHLIAIAAVFSQVLKKWSIPIVAVLCFVNLLVVNQYYVAMVHNGPAVRWTDAFTPLTTWLCSTKAPAILVADWGIIETLNLVSEGELPVEDAATAIRANNRAAMRNWMAADRDIWVTHSREYEQWPGQYDTLRKTAESLGYSQEMLQIIHDRNGRPIFEIFRFRHAG